MSIMAVAVVAAAKGVTSHGKDQTTATARVVVALRK